MSLSRRIKTEAGLQEEEVARAVRAYVAVLAANFRGRQVNATLPRVLTKIDEARAAGNAPDVAKIIKQVFLERDLAGLLD